MKQLPEVSCQLPVVGCQLPEWTAAAGSRLTVIAAVVVCSLTLAWAGGKQGIPARTSLGDYAVSQQKTELGIGANQLSRTEVHNSFATDLERGYVVVEVGVFPGSTGIDLKHASFVLRVPGTTTLVRPATPETIAAALQKDSQPRKSDITLYPTTTVGYETGGRLPNGQRAPGGLSTSTGVGVGVGGAGAPPRPASTPADRATMRTELQEKGLPEGALTKPTAGYLYFPLASKDKQTYQLEYVADGTRLVLALPQPKN